MANHSTKRAAARTRVRSRLRAPALVGLLLLVGTGTVAQATVLILKDGRRLEGPFAQVGGVAESPMNPKAPAGEVALTPLLIIDDGLRRTFIHQFYVQQVLDQAPERKVRIRIWQNVAERGAGTGRIGRALRVDPFDKYGRRIIEMAGRDGPLTIVQGITEITPVYTKVEGLMGASRPVVCDMRLATSSIPRDILNEILKTAVPQDDSNARLEVVRLYLESDRYQDAEQELARIIEDFPDMQGMQAEVRQLRQLGAFLILKEIQLRARAGQTRLARSLLAEFPSDGVAGATLEQVRQLLADYDTEDARRKSLLAQLDAQVALVADDNSRRLAKNFVQEIAAEASADALGRLASFERLADAAELTAEQKLALAISGWLVGANQATDNFHVAVSLASIRDLVVEYLREPTAAERGRLLGEMADLEGATVERVAQLIRLMKPPIDVPEDSARGPGRYEIPIAGLAGHEDARYVIQLPPEYDPLRHYPTIVTLSDALVAPESQLAFWTGAPRDEGEPLGQATRHGYITIAVDWQLDKQTKYDYSAREHHAVLGSLRDACRRFSIDTDRVYLSGHGIGGNAAWDLAIAHPDLWAGVMPVVAVADRYVRRYATNAKHLAWYVVAGELDGDKMAFNARELDRYLKPNADATVVEYLGRGYEPFGDEIQRLFDWMGRRRRTIPKEFEAVTMRPWDNFFWWHEVSGLPDKSMVAPATWPPPRGARPFRLSAELLEGNKVRVKDQAGRTTVWLGPEIVDFDEPITVHRNGRKISPRDGLIRPDLGVLLEDTRSRADRLHPFWAKIEVP